MKRFHLLAFIFVSLLAAPWSARADGADDQYIRIYSLIQMGDSLDAAGQVGDALARFLEAQTALQQFQKSYPDWNPKVVTFRLNDLAGKTRSATERVPPPATSKPGSPAASPPAATPAAVPTEQDRQLAAAREDVRQLQAEKATLEAKLK